MRTSRIHRGGVITRLGHGAYHARFDGVDLGVHPTPASAEWVIDDHVWYLLDAGLIAPTAVHIQALTDGLVAQGIPREIAAAHVQHEFGCSEQPIARTVVTA